MSRAAIAFLAVLASAVGARAQAALPPGWERTAIQPAPLFQTLALACDRERAYVRNSQGEVRAFDGRRWTALPRAPEPGALLWATPGGRLVVDGSGSAFTWQGARWTEIDVDPWLRHARRGERAVFAIDGLGESPWLLGRGAVGLDVRGDAGVILRAHDVADAWYALRDLEVLAFDRVYVASAAGLLRWDGRAWSIEPTGIDGEVGGVHAFAANDVWAWSDGGVAHFDGRTWTRRDQGLELPAPRAWRRGARETRVSLGGRPGQVHLTTGERVYRLNGSTWTTELDASHRHPLAHGYGEVCATERFVLIVEKGGFALVRR